MARRLSFADSLGVKAIVAQLEILAREDPVAWKVSPLLRRCAEAGQSLAEARPKQGAVVMKDLCITWLPSQNTLPGGNTRLRLPRSALPSFHVKMALCKGLYDATFLHLPGRSAAHLIRFKT